MLGAPRVCFDISQIVPQVRVGIWYRVCKEDRVIVVLTSVEECGSVKALAIVGDIFPDVVLKITDIVTALVPADIFLVSFFLAINRDPHAIVEKTVRFRVIEDVETNFGLSSCIFDLEEEPLCMALSVDVIGH